MNGRWKMAALGSMAGAVAVAVAVSCGGGGGGGGSGGATSRIQGNVSSSLAFLEPGSSSGSRFAWLSLGLVGEAWAQAAGVAVCLAGNPSTCTTTDANGSFVLTVTGDLPAPVCLTITGANFTANLCLPFAVPSGSVITLQEITCDVLTGTCQADDVDVEEPGEDVSEEVSDEDVPSEPSTPSDSTDDDVSEVDDDTNDTDDDTDDVSSSNSGSGDDDVEDDVEDDVSED